MSARDDYPANEMGFAQRRAMCDELDRLRAALAERDATVARLAYRLCEARLGADT